MSASQPRPLISVVVASYNYDDYIEQTLKSILDQTEGHFEIIVVDDASTDRSREVIESFTDRRISLYVNNRNLGSSPSYNRGAVQAKGDYITYIDADDWIDPRKFELQIQYFEQNPATDILGTYVSFHGADGSRHSRADAFERDFNQPHDFNAVGRWVRGNRLAATSVMLRRAVHERIGLRDPAMVSADFELWTRALRAGLKFDLLPESLLHFRVHDRSASMKRAPKDALLELMYIAHRNLLPIIKSPAEFRLVVKRVVSRKYFSDMDDSERYWYLFFLLQPTQNIDFAAFRHALLFGKRREKLLAAGRSWLDLLYNPSPSEKGRADRRIERYLSKRS